MKKNLIQKKLQKKEKKILLNVLQISWLRYHYFKKLVFFKFFEFGYIEEDYTKIKRHKIINKKRMIKQRSGLINNKEIKDYHQTMSKTIDSKVLKLVLRNANLRLFICMMCSFKIWKNAQSKNVFTIKRDKRSTLLNTLSKILRKYQNFIFSSIKNYSIVNHSKLLQIFSNISSRLLKQSFFLIFRQNPQKIFFVMNHIFSTQKKNVIKTIKKVAKTSKLLKTCEKLSFIQIISKKLAKNHKILKSTYFSI